MSVATVLTWSAGERGGPALTCLADWAPGGPVLLALAPGASPPPSMDIKTLRVESFWARATVVEILLWFESTGSEFLLWGLSEEPRIDRTGLDRLLSGARDSGSAIAYGDFMELGEAGQGNHHALIDYQPGSLRDDFDFGSLVLLSRAHLSGVAAEMEKGPRDLKSIPRGGWYDLRLRLAERGPVLHLSEPLYRVEKRDERASGVKVFDYVDPGKRDYQLEMEAVASHHLRRVGAFLAPPSGELRAEEHPFDKAASVIIPVKDRVATLADALKSALSQKTSFDFNVLVVDNHSSDGTTAVVWDFQNKDERCVPITPERRDLLIGGCWNEAIYSSQCGRIAVQLDSDDLYAGTHVLEKIVREFRRAPVALVVGSYTTVDFDLKTQPPGLVDHQEWTDTNGHNNALRIAGLGAPRAYHVPTLRTIGFPNVSYGEDYAVCLRLTRSYRVGRIYESLYWARRWAGNSDSALPLDVSNRYAAYKDRLRTIELEARKSRTR